MLSRRNGGGADQRRAAALLYDAVVAQARQPGFYRSCGVPDSLDGRFELVLLHAVLVHGRLRLEAERAAALGQALFDRMVEDLEINLREMGVGDMGLPRRMRRMTEAFYGRLAAYAQALAANEPEALETALARNLFGTVTPAAAELSRMADYVRRQHDRLAEQDYSALAQGALRFAPGPELGGAPDD
jgi:cytochrome b pre-mRNA-processing protein 3